MNKILFIGTGKMATAITGGMIKSGFNPESISGYDISPASASEYTHQTSVKAYSDNLGELIQKANTIILAVKPQYLKEALSTCQGLLNDKFIISIVGGATIDIVASYANCPKVVRVMPNTPALIKEAMSVYCTKSQLTDEEISLVERILGSIGKFYRSEERLMDAVTALSGCGPAYVYDFIQALADGGVACGLPRDMALALAVQTVKGSAEMIAQTKLHPGVLRDQVTSPGGATIQGVAELERNGFRGIVMDAVDCACERSKAMAPK